MNHSARLQVIAIAALIACTPLFSEIVKPSKDKIQQLKEQQDLIKKEIKKIGKKTDAINGKIDELIKKHTKGTITDAELTKQTNDLIQEISDLDKSDGELVDKFHSISKDLQSKE